jgi:hypothetical protein
MDGCVVAWPGTCVQKGFDGVSSSSINTAFLQQVTFLSHQNPSHILHGHNAGITCLSSVKGRNLLCSGSMDGEIILWSPVVKTPDAYGTPFHGALM